MNFLYKLISGISEKLKSIDKRVVRASATIVVIFVLIWIAYGYHINEFSHAYKEVMMQLTMSETENENEEISSGINESCGVIRYAAVSCSKVAHGDFAGALGSIISNCKDSGYFIDVVYINEAGRVYFENGTVSDNPLSVELIEQCDKSKPYTVFANKDNFLTNEESFGIISPIFMDDSIEGYMCGIVTFSEIRDDEFFGNISDHKEVIIDRDGNIVVEIKSADDEFPEAGNNDFFSYAEAAMSPDDYRKFVSDYYESLNAGRVGSSFVTLDNEGGMLFVYFPIESTDGWVIMNCYADGAIKARTTQIQIKSIAIFLMIIVMFVLAVIILLNYLNQEHKKLSDLKYLDGLTGAYNRSAFITKAEEVIRENKNLPYKILCFDVINFRIINETYGHERSDEIIKAMAEACKESVGHNEAYGRLTADVYVAAIVDDGEEEERIKFIEEYIEKKAKAVYINHPIRIKRGVYTVLGEEESVNRMIDKANIARKYADYENNKFVCEYTSELMNDARKAEEIESCMAAALNGGEFRPYLQAKFDMKNNKVCGAEALVRWIKPDGTVIPPGDFIPLFEKNGFVEKIDFYMLEEICKYIRRMIDEGRDVYKVSVNQSRYLMNDPEYVNNVQKVLLKYQIPVGLIELELTETVFFHEKERMIKMMNDLKKMNVDLSIDDFGTGYSSFNILKDVPFDGLKIDRVFLIDAVHTDKGKIILKEIVQMAYGLGMRVICEGVETKEQADLLMSIGCNYAQGFLFARPVPMEEFIEKYNTK